MGNSDCSGNWYINQYEPIAATNGAVVAKNYFYGNGVPIPAGSFSVYGDNDIGWTVIQGYYVPAGWVRASSFQSPSAVPGSRRPSASAKE